MSWKYNFTTNLNIYRNKLNDQIKSEKLNYYKTLSEINKDSSSEFWNSLKFLYNSIKSDNFIGAVKNHEDNLITNNFEIAETLNKYFSEIAKNLVKKILRIPIIFHRKKDFVVQYTLRKQLNSKKRIY